MTDSRAVYQSLPNENESLNKALQADPQYQIYQQELNELDAEISEYYAKNKHYDEKFFEEAKSLADEYFKSKEQWEKSDQGSYNEQNALSNEFEGRKKAFQDYLATRGVTLENFSTREEFQAYLSAKENLRTYLENRKNQIQIASNNYRNQKRIEKAEKNDFFLVRWFKQLYRNAQNIFKAKEIAGATTFVSGIGVDTVNYTGKAITGSPTPAISPAIPAHMGLIGGPVAMISIGLATIWDIGTAWRDNSPDKKTTTGAGLITLGLLVTGILVTVGVIAAVPFGGPIIFGVLIGVGIAKTEAIIKRTEEDINKLTTTNNKSPDYIHSIAYKDDQLAEQLTAVSKYKPIAPNQTLENYKALVLKKDPAVRRIVREKMRLEFKKDQLDLQVKQLKETRPLSTLTILSIVGVIVGIAVPILLPLAFIGGAVLVGTIVAGATLANAQKKEMAKKVKEQQAFESNEQAFDTYVGKKVGNALKFTNIKANNSQLPSASPDEKLDQKLNEKEGHKHRIPTQPGRSAGVTSPLPPSSAHNPSSAVVASLSAPASAVSAASAPVVAKGTIPSKTDSGIAPAPSGNSHLPAEDHLYLTISVFGSVGATAGSPIVPQPSAGSNNGLSLGQDPKPSSPKNGKF